MFFAVILCKLIRFVGQLVGRGSSLPGQIVLKLFPNILSKLKLPDTVIAVSGSNGKTSTVEMIAHILQENGKHVIWNREGSNQTEGVATLLLCASTLTGRVKGDVVLLESDERYARRTFRFFSPSHFVITNLYRDQMTRNGHNEWIYDILADAVKTESCLILNADDPLVSCFAQGHANTVWYSMDQNDYSTAESVGRYHDGCFCPICKHPMEYEYFNYASAGRFRCTNCDFASAAPKYRVTHVDLGSNSILFDGTHPATLAFNGLFNIYNMLSAYALCCEVGIPAAKAAEALSGYVMKNGRINSFSFQGKPALLLISKHENSVSYNSSIDYVVRSAGPCEVLVMVNAISRKYYTGETSWLYDIDFERLSADNVNRIILCGKYCRDLQLRFLLAGLAHKI
ncbi:MAG: MurT ligase domain-containing protein, partial [Oscillospiraceae bacterium]|nr:MurT ligase domain-containing protein [Oscillospiraceae bacterium]